MATNKLLRGVRSGSNWVITEGLHKAIRSIQDGESRGLPSKPDFGGRCGSWSQIPIGRSY